jgi:hypothetical protein
MKNTGKKTRTRMDFDGENLFETTTWKTEENMARQY